MDWYIYMRVLWLSRHYPDAPLTPCWGTGLLGVTLVLGRLAERVRTGRVAAGQQRGCNVQVQVAARVGRAVLARSASVHRACNFRCCCVACRRAVGSSTGRQRSAARAWLPLTPSPIQAAELVTDAKDRGLHGASGGVRQVAAPWLEVTAPRGTLVPVNRDGEPEEAAERYVEAPRAFLLCVPCAALVPSLCGLGRRQAQPSKLKRPHASDDTRARRSATSLRHLPSPPPFAVRFCFAARPPPRLLFEVLPKRLMVHMPDDRLLVSRPKDGSNIQDAEAAAGISGGASGARRAPGTRRPATAGKVRRAVLRRMMAAVQPEGREMRLRAGLRAAAARAASAGALFALGFAAGLWARRGGAGRGGSRSRREAPAPPRAPAVAGGSHRGRRAARAGGVAVPAVPAGPLQQVVSWAGLAA